MNNVQNCDSYMNIMNNNNDINIVTNLLIALTCWARSCDVMCFL
jgi:hypothetical protein